MDGLSDNQLRAANALAAYLIQLENYNALAQQADRTEASARQLMQQFNQELERCEEMFAENLPKFSSNDRQRTIILASLLYSGKDTGSMEKTLPYTLEQVALKSIAITDERKIASQQALRDLFDRDG